MSFTLYTDPQVSHIMREMATGLAWFNDRAEAAFNQSTQSLAVPSEAPPAVAAGEPLSPLAPSPAVSNSPARLIGYGAMLAYSFALTCAWAYFTVPA